MQVNKGPLVKQGLKEPKIKGSKKKKANVAMNFWPPQASYLY